MLGYVPDKYVIKHIKETNKKQNETSHRLYINHLLNGDFDDMEDDFNYVEYMYERRTT